MALVDYIPISELSYAIDTRLSDGTVPLICSGYSESKWISEVFGLTAKSDIYSKQTFYFTDKQLTLFILKFGK